jgi:asparagine synthetase B (glutamine-hydrolysing)
MPITTILNKEYHSYGMYTLIAKNLLGLKTNDSNLIYTPNINIVFEGELFNFDELLNLICMNKNYCSEEEKMEYLFNTVHFSKGLNKYSALIIYLYCKYGIDQMLQLIDGAFNFILFDINLSGDYSNLYIVNDPFGTKKYI